MSKSKNVKIDLLHLFSEAHNCYLVYENTRSANAYGRYLELRRLFLESNISTDYTNYVFGAKRKIAKSGKISSVYLIERAALLYDYNKNTSNRIREGRYDALMDIILDYGLAESYFKFIERGAAYAKKN